MDIAEFIQYQYLFDQVAGLQKSGNEKAFTSHFVTVSEKKMLLYRAKMVRFETEKSQQNRCDLEQRNSMLRYFAKRNESL